MANENPQPKSKTQSQVPPWTPLTHAVKLLLPQIRLPRYPANTVMRLDRRITYRQINSWEQNGLIAPARATKKTGWRKFSFAEMVQLLIISDLKELGISTPVLRHALGWLTHFPPGTAFFDILLVGSVRGGRPFLFIGADGAPTVVFNDADAISALTPPKAKAPVVCCPFHDYVRRVLALSDVDLRQTGSGVPRSLSSDELELLRIIRDEQYEHLEIIKSNGAVQTIKATARRRGRFTLSDVVFQLQAGNFRSITVTKKDGEIVNVTSTEITKF